MSAQQQQQPYKLMSCNTAPERAKRIIARIIEDTKDKYSIVHCANAENIDMVEPLVKEHRPDVLITASMWTPEQSQHIQSIARGIIPNIRTFALPHGYQVEHGPEATAEYVKSHLDEIMSGMAGGK